MIVILLQLIASLRKKFVRVSSFITFLLLKFLEAID